MLKWKDQFIFRIFFFYYYFLFSGFSKNYLLWNGTRTFQCHYWYTLKIPFIVGAPGWLSQLSIQLLISAQVLISGCKFKPHIGFHARSGAYLIHFWDAWVAQHLSVCLWLRVWSRDLRWSPTSGSLQEGCFSFCLCLCPPFFLSLSLCVSVSHE